MLKRMPFHACATVMVPIMTRKLRAVAAGVEMIGLLKGIRIGQVDRSNASATFRSMEQSLQALRLRNLAKMLHAKAPHGTQERAVMDRLLQQMQGLPLLLQ